MSSVLLYEIILYLLEIRHLTVMPCLSGLDCLKVFNNFWREGQDTLVRYMIYHEILPIWSRTNLF